MEHRSHCNQEKWIYPLSVLQLPTGVLAVTTRLIAGDVLRISISHDESDAFSFMASGDTLNGHFVLHVKGDEILPLLTETQMELVRDNRKSSSVENRRLWGVNGVGNGKSEEDWPRRQLISELADMLDLISNPKDHRRRRLVLRAKDADSPTHMRRDRDQRSRGSSLGMGDTDGMSLTPPVTPGGISGGGISSKRGRTPGTRGSMGSRASEGAVGHNPLFAVAQRVWKRQLVLVSHSVQILLPRRQERWPRICLT